MSNVDQIHVLTVDDQPLYCSTLMHILVRYVKNRHLDQAHLYGHQESIKHCLPSQCPSSYLSINALFKRRLQHLSRVLFSAHILFSTFYEYIYHNH